VRSLWFLCLIALAGSACGSGVRRHPTESRPAPPDALGARADGATPPEMKLPPDASADGLIADGDDLTVDAAGPIEDGPAPIEDAPPPTEDTAAQTDVADDLSLDAPPEETAPGLRRCDGKCEWTPADLGERLVVWLDAARSVTVAGGKVARWSDLSTWGNHAVQPLPAWRPAVVSDAFGSRPGIALNPNPGDHQFLVIPDAPSLHFGTDPFMLVVVAKTARGPGAHAALWSKQENREPNYVGPSLWLVHDDIVGNGRLMLQVAFVGAGQAHTTAEGFNQMVPFILTGRRLDATTLRVRVGGMEDDHTLPLDLASLDLSAPGTDVMLGAHRELAVQQEVRGAYAEIIAIHGAITEEELGSLERYLESRYAPVVF
jgi:hypothetical protein